MCPTFRLFRCQKIPCPDRNAAPYILPKGHTALNKPNMRNNLPPQNRRLARQCQERDKPCQRWVLAVSAKPVCLAHTDYPGLADRQSTTQNDQKEPMIPAPSCHHVIHCISGNKRGQKRLGSYKHKGCQEFYPGESTQMTNFTHPTSALEGPGPRGQWNKQDKQAMAGLERDCMCVVAHRALPTSGHPPRKPSVYLQEAGARWEMPLDTHLR